MIKLLLVDDEVAVREGLRMRLALEPDLIVVGEACNGAEAMQAALALAPDVVVMDVEMPLMDGLRAAGLLRNLSPQTQVVMLSVHGDAETRTRAEAAGACAFVEKRGGGEALLAAIRGAAQSASH